MGACASCLGLKRGHLHDDDDADLDRLLDSAQPAYGAVDLSQPDDEELMREREALDHITAHAADHMIDVSHPARFDTDRTQKSIPDQKADHMASDACRHRLAGGQEEADENAWLESIQKATVGQVHVPERGSLVMDMSVLRDKTQPRRSGKHDSSD